MNRRIDSKVIAGLFGHILPFSRRNKRLRSRTANRLHMGILVASFLAASYATWLLIHATPTTPLQTGESNQTVKTVVDDSTPSQSDARFTSQPTWFQDFSGSTKTLSSEYWNVLIGPAENSNKEQQYYTDDAANLRIEDGALRIIATKKDYPGGYKYGSARLETQGKKSFKYGRIDITAKLPAGSGTWPAVWMLPDNDTYAKKSPESDTMRYKNGGEIDIVEAVGFQPDTVYGVAHTVSDLVKRGDGTGSHKSVNVKSTEYNTYTLLWTPTSLAYAVNGSVFFTYTRQDNADYTTWPFDQPFYLIANLAIGGTWGGMDTKRFPGNGVDDSALPASLDIRSIHYYPYVQG